jgi:GntR family transcriptional repressor for pyruvate dehydrogenase complex
MSFVVDLHADSSILEFFAVRRILEPAAVALAAARMPDATVADLRAQLDSVDTSTTVDELIEHDLAFHSAIVAEAGNAYLASLIESLSSHTVRARMWRALTQRNAVDRTLAEHRAILDALERGDAELAHALTTVHISGVEQWLQEGVRLAARGVHLRAGTG